MDYRYNIRGWLTDINNNDLVLMGNKSFPGTQNDDLFSFSIYYNELNRDAENGFVKELYNGNISQAFWKTGSDNTKRGYNYTYDKLNRLRRADFHKTGNPNIEAYGEFLSYDINGNIVSLYRTTGDEYDNEIEMDDLTYQYFTDSNRLKNVTDAVSSGDTGGFVDGNIHTSTNLDDYEYDLNGNLILDRNKGIQSITYNYLNLPEEIIFDSTHKIEYLYNAAGVRIQKMVRDGDTIKTVDYLDGFQYAGAVLQFFPTAEGYVNATPIEKNNTEYGFDYVFNYTDHLGNVRLSYTLNPENGVLEILDETHYYPFGLKHEVYVPASKQTYTNIGDTMIALTSVRETDYQYKYNGKEWQDELGLNFYDYGARNYDPTIGRWMNMDPHAERYPEWSPYSFVFNNPLIFIDPDGRDPIYGKNFWGRTKLIGDDGKEDGQVYLVSGAVKRDVKRASKAGENYTGSLAENDNVFKIPTGGVMDDVINSVNDTRTSEKENGGHANFGDTNATRWDEGPPAFAYTDADGVEKVKAMLTMFIIGGKNMMPSDASNVEYWWHTHPNTTVNGASLGNSNPSEADFIGQATMQNRGFKGNTFVIGVRSETVTFYNKDKALITVKYADFKTMGGK